MSAKQSSGSQWGGVASRATRSLAAAALVFGSARAAVAQHPDPPSNPAIQTVIDVAELTFLTDQDDGVDGCAELLLIVQVNWGGSHGVSTWLLTRTIDMDDGNRWVVFPPRVPNVFTHTECSPVFEPAIDTYGYELDGDLCWLSELVVIAGGGALGAVGGPAGAALGASIAYLTADLLSELNGNDVLARNTDYTFTAESNYINLGFQEFCEVARAVAPGAAVPAPPGGVVPPPPSDFPVGPPDEDFHTYKAPLYRAAAAASPTPEGRQQYLAMAEFGIDEYHTFGRSACYAEGQFGRLIDVLDQIDAVTLETGADISLTQVQLEASLERGRGLTVGVAYIVAAQEYSEAAIRGADPALLVEVSRLMGLARSFAESGSYAESIRHYEKATTLVMGEIHPTFGAGASLDDGPPLGVRLTGSSRFPGDSGSQVVYTNRPNAIGSVTDDNVTLTVVVDNVAGTPMSRNLSICSDQSVIDPKKGLKNSTGFFRPVGGGGGIMNPMTFPVGRTVLKFDISTRSVKSKIANIVNKRVLNLPFEVILDDPALDVDPCRLEGVFTGDRERRLLGLRPSPGLGDDDRPDAFVVIQTPVDVGDAFNVRLSATDMPRVPYSVTGLELVAGEFGGSGLPGFDAVELRLGDPIFVGEPDMSVIGLLSAVGIADGLGSVPTGPPPTIVTMNITDRTVDPTLPSGLVGDLFIVALPLPGETSPTTALAADTTCATLLQSSSCTVSGDLPSKPAAFANFMLRVLIDGRRGTLAADGIRREPHESSRAAPLITLYPR